MAYILNALFFAVHNNFVSKTEKYFGRARNEEIVSFTLFTMTYSRIERALLLNVGDVLMNLVSI
jgi:hypothetical protein